MQYLLIDTKTGIVMNVVEWDGKTQWDSDHLVHPCSAGLSIGHTVPAAILAATEAPSAMLARATNRNPQVVLPIKLR